MQIYFAVMKFN